MLMPMAIISPKSITGRIRLTISDPNPTIVVSDVYRHGTATWRIVSNISVRLSISGLPA
jgi:hypothetical protein